MDAERFTLRGLTAYNLDDDSAILVGRDGQPRVIAFATLDRDGEYQRDEPLPAHLLAIWDAHKEQIARQKREPKLYSLRDRADRAITSYEPGRFGGNTRNRVYGRLDCPAALRALPRGIYQRFRVFFADEETARAAGYRPCSCCLPGRAAQRARDLGRSQPRLL